MATHSAITRDPSTGLLGLLPGLVYGPVRSRRLGLSLGVNILPAAVKTCTFNCVYCQYGWTRAHDWAALPWPSPRAVADALARALDASSTPDHITVAGHGEPTLHPAFAEVVAAVREVRDRFAPQTRLAVLSNGTCAHVPAVRAALLQVDDRYLKLDAGDQATLRRVNASAFPHGQLIDTLRSLPGITLQSLFVHDPRGRCGNASDEDAARWLDAVCAIRPARVHIYTIDRQPALARLQPVPRAQLDALASRVADHGIATEVFD